MIDSSGMLETYSCFLQIFSYTLEPWVANGTVSDFCQHARFSPVLVPV